MTPRFNPWMIATLVLAGVIMGFFASKLPFLQGKEAQTSTATQQQNQPSAPATRTLTEEQTEALPDDDPAFGDEDAPVTVVEFSDFQCPYCGKFFKLTLPLIEENYIKTGKVRFVYRDFPLDFHANALPAANAAQCANDQQKFKEMHDMIFENQQTWSESATAADAFKDYAKQIGLNMTQYNECVLTNKHALEIRKDLIDGSAVGVTGTPGFFVNGKELSGAMPYEIFKPVLDAELEGKTWALQFDASGRLTGVKVD